MTSEPVRDADLVRGEPMVEGHPDDYDKCDCSGLEEHARVMGTWPLLAIPKEPYADA